ncbi:F-box protein CPR1-like [Ziziphus jujuba]|uniref:F-box protein CPR1-like n=1 Tax=Ziziphus jujuba TaxID=326968 RepID=A0ABM3IAX9_ZIZJJ|nr:F-box protein CPR1-like [Ziziphus jujuba]
MDYIHKEKYNSGNALDFEMYSLKTNSWKRIASAYNSHKDLRVHNYSCGIFSNGMLSWKASYREDGDIPCTNAIISVDLNSETIITTPLPSSIGHINHPPSDLMNNYCLVYKEALALVHWFTEARKRSFDIWVLGEYGVKDSWKKLFTIGLLEELLEYWDFWGIAKCLFKHITGGSLSLNSKSI